MAAPHRLFPHALVAAAMAAVTPVIAQEQAPVADTAEAGAEAPSEELATEIAAGEQEYLAACRACHGSRGTAGVPLANNEKVMYDYGYLAWAIITGPGYMPAFDEALSDEQIAKISTFILNSWGNSYGLITPEDIRAVR
jgi:mono/diheme cytochrome c family protein